jgi:hypothetical protein
LAIFQNVAKIPEELLASAAIWEFEKSAEKESPALSMIEQMFKKGQAHNMFSRIFSTKYYVICDEFIRWFHKFSAKLSLLSYSYVLLL